MSQKLRIIWPVFLLLLGLLASTLAARADEHDRARAEARVPSPARGQRESVGPRESAGRPSFDGRGQVLDNRYNHGRYYPRAGAFRPSLPDGYRPYYRGGDR